MSFIHCVDVLLHIEDYLRDVLCVEFAAVPVFVSLYSLIYEHRSSAYSSFAHSTSLLHEKSLCGVIDYIEYAERVFDDSVAYSAGIDLRIHTYGSSVYEQVKAAFEC